MGPWTKYDAAIGIHVHSIGYGRGLDTTRQNRVVEWCYMYVSRACVIGRSGSPQRRRIERLFGVRGVAWRVGRGVWGVGHGVWCGGVWGVACGWLGGTSSSSLGASFVLAVRPCLCECDCGAGVVLVLPERWHLF